MTPRTRPSRRTWRVLPSACLAALLSGAATICLAGDPAAPTDATGTAPSASTTAPAPDAVTVTLSVPLPKGAEAKVKAPDKATKERSLQIKRILKQVFAHDPVPITVTADPNPADPTQYVISLSGDGIDPDRATAAIKLAQQFSTSRVLVLDNMNRVAPDSAPAPITLTYTLRFLRDSLPNTVGSNGMGSDISGIGVDNSATQMATFLKSIYEDTAVTAQENHLVLTGPAAHVNHLRQMLALVLDVPSPQVRADVYTIQVNTTPHNRDEAQEKIEEIAAGIQLVRDLIHGSEGGLSEYISSGRLMFPDAQEDVMQKLTQAGYDTNPNRPLSLVDMLIFLTLAKNPEAFTKDLLPSDPSDPDYPVLAGHLEQSLYNIRQKLKLGQSPLSISSSLYPVSDAAVFHRHSKDLIRLIDRVETRLVLARGEKNTSQSSPIFPRTAALFDPLAGKTVIDPNAAQIQRRRVQDNDIRGICDFLDAWHSCAGTFLPGAKITDLATIAVAAKVKADTAKAAADTAAAAAKTTADRVAAAPKPPIATPKPSDPREYPDWLSRRSASTDNLLKEAMDALTADLQDIFFQPLLDWIREDVRNGHSTHSGIDLVGTTSLTIRDRTLGETRGDAESYFKFTAIPHLTQGSLADAKTLAAGTPATPDTTTQTVATDKNGVVKNHGGDPVLLTSDKQLAIDPTTKEAIRMANGDPVVVTVPAAAQTRTPSSLAATALGALTPLQALALQAAFAEDAVAPTYRSVAPGTSLAIRPFVLSDGGSARIQMSLTSAVTVDQPDAAGLAARDVPFDLIRSHTVTTEETISAFDLETVSSFGVQTTAPGDYLWRIPLLDQIPLLGALFHGPRSTDTKRQDSIAIVNLTILPRSLDLVPFYVDVRPPTP